MKFEKRLYSVSELRNEIILIVEDLYNRIQSAKKSGTGSEATISEQWEKELLPTIEQTIAEEIVRRHVQGVTFAVWAGPPGSGKGTNIETIKCLGDLYAELTSQGGASRFDSPIHEKLLACSVNQGYVVVGTGGIFNKPVGEYDELFSKLSVIVSEMVASGDFPGDSMVNSLVELMILLRLVQGCHKIQIDLWPRTLGQFKAFSNLIKAIKNAGGKINQELVNIRVVDSDSVDKISKKTEEFAKASVSIGKEISSIVSSNDYLEKVRKGMNFSNELERYNFEKVELNLLFGHLEDKFSSESERIVIQELKVICERMAYRFDLELKKGMKPRPDAFPLSWIKRLMIYTSETSPAFLFAAAEEKDGVDITLISSFYKPEVVITEVLNKLIGTPDDKRWKEVLTLAGEIAVAIVSKDELIVSSLLERLEGIMTTEY